MAHRVHLLVIDPQNDFTDPHGSLAVPGGDEDMKRLARMVTRLRDRLAAIHVTLDSHRRVDISHPIWFRDGRGRHPAPFTTITADDLRSGRWSTTRTDGLPRTLAYLEALDAGRRYPHVVWPYHCLIGDTGHNVHPELAAAIHDWEERFAMADFVTKGSNPWTEHFSAVRAEVPDPDDPTTQLNGPLLKTLRDADVVLLAGEALSHCLAHTVRDVADTFGDPALIRKLVLLTDATSSVPGFEAQGHDFVADLTRRGMRLSTTADVDVPVAA